MRKALAVIFVFVSAYCFSQSNKQRNKLFSIRGNVGITRPITSAMFNTCFAGVYEANVSANLRLFNNFYAGVGYDNCYFQNSKFLTRQYFGFSIPYNTDFTGNGVFIKLGYDKFITPKSYMSYSLNTGLMFMKYNKVNFDSSAVNQPFGKISFSTPYVQPEVSVNFIADTHLSFSVLFSYTTLFMHFDPKAPRFNQFKDISSKGNSYVMSWINIGFGFNVLIGK